MNSYRHVGTQSDNGGGNVTRKSGTDVPNDSTRRLGYGDCNVGRICAIQTMPTSTKHTTKRMTERSGCTGQRKAKINQDDQGRDDRCRQYRLAIFARRSRGVSFERDYCLRLALAPLPPHVHLKLCWSFQRSEEGTASELGSLGSALPKPSGSAAHSDTAEQVRRQLYRLRQAMALNLCVFQGFHHVPWWRAITGLTSPP